MSDHPSDPFAAPGPPAAGHQFAPDEVWAQAREDYLAGLSAPQVCRRLGLNLATLRSRATREGWRRADQPWVPPQRLDPRDEGVLLETNRGGDLAQIEPRELAFVAECRMMRAVLRGEAAEALRWRRVRDAMRLEQADLDRFIAEEEEWAFQNAPPPPGRTPDSSDSSGSDSFFGVGTVDLAAPAVPPPDIEPAAPVV